MEFLKDEKSLLALLFWSAHLQKKVILAWYKYSIKKRKENKDIVENNQPPLSNNTNLAKLATYYFHWRSVTLKRKYERIREEHNKALNNEIKMPTLRKQPRKPSFLLIPYNYQFDCSKETPTNRIPPNHAEINYSIPNKYEHIDSNRLTSSNSRIKNINDEDDAPTTGETLLPPSYFADRISDGVISTGEENNSNALLNGNEVNFDKSKFISTDMSKSGDEASFLNNLEINSRPRTNRNSDYIGGDINSNFKGCTIIDQNCDANYKFKSNEINDEVVSLIPKVNNDKASGNLVPHETSRNTDFPSMLCGLNTKNELIKELLDIRNFIRNYVNENLSSRV